jgi:hypothetical protein
MVKEPSNTKQWMEEEPNPVNCSIRVINNNTDIGYIWVPDEHRSAVIDPTDLFLDPSLSDLDKELIKAKKPNSE